LTSRNARLASRPNVTRAPAAQNAIYRTVRSTYRLFALAVHHFVGAGNADLFRRVAGNLTPGGRIVLGDVVVLPDDPSDLVTPIDGDYDTPSAAADQLRWLAAAGLQTRVAWAPSSAVEGHAFAAEIALEQGFPWHAGL
jgi:hypothetical protein